MSNLHLATPYSVDFFRSSLHRFFVGRLSDEEESDTCSLETCYTVRSRPLSQFVRQLCDKNTSSLPREVLIDHGAVAEELTADDPAFKAE